MALDGVSKFRNYGFIRVIFVFTALIYLPLITIALISREIQIKQFMGNCLYRYIIIFSRITK